MCRVPSVAAVPGLTPAEGRGAARPKDRRPGAKGVPDRPRGGPRCGPAEGASKRGTSDKAPAPKVLCRPALARPAGAAVRSGRRSE